MSLSKNIDFNSFYGLLEKAWQPIWLANFIYCYLFVDIFSFYFSGSGIFNYSLMHILELSFANIIITITAFGIFSILFLPIIDIILRGLIIEIDFKFFKSLGVKDDYRSSRGYVSCHQLSDSKLVKKFETHPDYLIKIYLTESEKYNLKLNNLFKLQTLILGIIIFSIFEIFIIDSVTSNTICCYFQALLEEKEIGYFSWVIYITILFLLSISYYNLCDSFPEDRFYNPVLYEQIQSIKND